MCRVMIEILEEAGLTRTESTVYLTLLQLGTSKSGEILKKSRLNSGKIYEILDSLQAKGLVSISMINRVKHFTAAPPTQIINYIEKKKEALEQQEQKMKLLLPDLEKLRGATKEETKAITYTGFRGMKTAVDEVMADMKAGDEILGMGITKLKDERFNNMWRAHAALRVRKKIYVRMIFSERSEYYLFYKKLPYTEAKVLSAFTPVAVDIFGKDKVLILNYTEPVSCTLIYDKNTATSFIQFFNGLWKAGED